MSGRTYFCFSVRHGHTRPFKRIRAVEYAQQLPEGLGRLHPFQFEPFSFEPTWRLGLSPAPHSFRLKRAEAIDLERCVALLAEPAAGYRDTHAAGRGTPRQQSVHRRTNTP